MSIIQKIFASEVIDSRGNPTVEVEITLNNGDTARGIAPSGASTGSYEAVELRDQEKTRYLGKGVLKAVDNVNNIIAPQIIGKDCLDQLSIDQIMIDLDGTKNKSNLGANAILATSIANLNVAARFQKKLVCEFLNPNCEFMPIPMMNFINGGAHADNNISIQEHMIMPVGHPSFAEALRCGAEIFHCLKQILQENSLSTNVGDEGGFAPDLQSTEQTLEMIIKAIKKAGYKPGENVYLALDAASTEFYKPNIDKYTLRDLGAELSRSELVAFYKDLAAKYPIASIEDGMAENDLNGWKELTDSFANKVQLVGDDVFVTNLGIFKDYVKANIANAILIKPNQIGTISETLEVVNFAKANNYNAVISHRSGETEDVTIAHLAVATGVKQIKTGSLSRVDRTAKYNELLRIERYLGTKAKYPSKIPSCM